MSALRRHNKFAGLSVLVVEDETLIFYLIEQILVELGCASVWRATDVETALSLLKERRPDVAILDVNLMGKLSYPVAVRLNDQGIPLVFVTGFGRVGMPEFWRDRPFIEKPFTIEGLVTALDSALKTETG
jgi:two-component SAPR family response regulator